MGSYQPKIELFWVVAAIIGVAVLSQLRTTYYHNGLNRYPGPMLAKFTRLWHWLDVKGNRHQQNLIELHRKYGDVVRIGPNSLSISSPEFVPRLYGVSQGYLKLGRVLRKQ
ncbi:Cytochrome P450 monooxygenase FCK2 [Lachnellula suecica]|uniref:Cytochrome P450 monooxygenase FCK2 n=1 Tax=Lachnellula suecica TaxID=602035 RepID=A0A8T9BT86_9HELO|nr:Cytochrome P450 monooxygenase FCK2 [Lachnellula suecica]